EEQIDRFVPGLEVILERLFLLVTRLALENESSPRLARVGRVHGNADQEIALPRCGLGLIALLADLGQLRKRQVFIEKMLLALRDQWTSHSSLFCSTSRNGAQTLTGTSITRR